MDTSSQANDELLAEIVGRYLIKTYIGDGYKQIDGDSFDQRYQRMTGPNGMNTSVYYNSVVAMKYLLSQSVKWATNPETLPESFGQHYVYQEYVSGDRTQLCNYHKLFVPNAEYTILSIMTGSRLLQLLAPLMPSENITLKEDSSNTEAIHMVQTAAKAVSTANTSGLFVFLDCAMVDETISHTTIMQVLRTFGMSANMCALVLRMISILSISPVVNGQPLPFIPMKRGLPWGNVLGRVLNTAVSVLFSQALESFLVSTDYPAVPGVLQHVVYNQGIAVFLSSPAALARLEKAIEFYSQATSIVIRIKHCKVVQVGTEPDQAIPDIWTKIPRGQKVKYFNSEFSMQA